MRPYIGQRGYTGPTLPSISMIGGLAQITGTSNTQTTYFGSYVAGTSLEVDTTESNVITRIPFDCSISDFYVDLTSSPGSGANYIFTIRKNLTDTSSVSVTISDSSSNNSDTTHTAIFNAGDILTISSNPSNITIPALTSVRWSCKLTSI